MIVDCLVSYTHLDVYKRQVRERLAKLESGKQDTDLKLKELHQLLSAAKSGGRDFSAERTKAVASTRTTKSQRNEQDQ